MATTVQLERLIGRALMNPQFGQEILSNPVAAARSMRIRLDPDQIERIQGVKSEALERIARDLREAIPPSSAPTIKLW